MPDVGRVSSWKVETNCMEREMSSKTEKDAYKNYVRPTILCRSKAWCLEENKTRIFRKGEKPMERAMGGIQLKDRKIAKDLMPMFGADEKIDQLHLTNNAHWYGHRLTKDNGHILRKA